MDAEAHFRDHVGEDTASSDCALCHAVSCFSCVQGYCTALEKFTFGECVFYKDAAQNRKEIRKCFYRLISHERFDLLRKYAGTMAALGLMDVELTDVVGKILFHPPGTKRYDLALKHRKPKR